MKTLKFKLPNGKMLTTNHSQKEVEIVKSVSKKILVKNPKSSVSFVPKHKKSKVIKGLNEIVSYFKTQNITRLSYHRLDLQTSLNSLKQYGCTSTTIMEIFTDINISQYYGGVDAMFYAFENNILEKQFVARFEPNSNIL